MARELNLDKPCEHIDYTLVPVMDDNGKQAWNIMILRAPFDGTTIRFGNIQFDGSDQSLRFNFEIVDSSDEELTTDNVELQQFAADVLEDILQIAAKEGSLVTRDADGNKSGTNDSEESTD